jgi:hypothetical protein
MKFSLAFTIASAILVIIVIVALIVGSSKIRPYNAHSIHDLSSYPQEGFDTVSSLPYSEVDNPSAPESKAKDQTLGYSSAMEQGPSKVEGFEGLQSAPYTDEKVLDIYSQVKGSSNCPESPYSNSKGYLCMDPTGVNLLMTRGGNQTGAFDSQMGP